MKTDTASSPLILGAALDQRAVAAAQAEFRQMFPEFCRTLNITQPMLAKLQPQVVEMLAMMRMFSLISTQLITLETRLAELETSPPESAPPEPMQ